MDPHRGKLISEWISAGEHTIHMRTSAGEPRRPELPPVVLVHGLVISSLYMVPTAIRLAPQVRLFAPDLPGFGRSSKPRRTLTISEHATVLREWLDAVALRRAILVGNSFGCQVIVELGARWPESVAGAVLAGPTMDPGARTAERQIGRWLIDWTRERPSLFPAHVRDYAKAGLRRAIETFRYALADPIEEKLPLLSAPTLVVRGSRDVIVPQEWAARAAALLPSGELSVIAGGPHVVNYTTPEAFAALVLSFAERIVSRG